MEKPSATASLVDIFQQLKSGMYNKYYGTVINTRNCYHFIQHVQYATKRMNNEFVTINTI